MTRQGVSSPSSPSWLCRPPASSTSMFSSPPTPWRGWIRESCGRSSTPPHPLRCRLRARRPVTAADPSNWQAADDLSRTDWWCGHSLMSRLSSTDPRTIATSSTSGGTLPHAGSAEPPKPRPGQSPQEGRVVDAGQGGCHATLAQREPRRTVVRSAALPCFLLTGVPVGRNFDSATLASSRYPGIPIFRTGNCQPRPTVHVAPAPWRCFAASASTSRSRPLAGCARTPPPAASCHLIVALSITPCSVGTPDPDPDPLSLAGSRTRRVEIDFEPGIALGRRGQLPAEAVLAPGVGERDARLRSRLEPVIEHREAMAELQSRRRWPQGRRASAARGLHAERQRQGRASAARTCRTRATCPDTPSFL